MDVTEIRQLLANTWYVASDREEIELEADIKDLLDEEDGLLIQAVKREAILTNGFLPMPENGIARELIALVSGMDERQLKATQKSILRIVKER